MTTIMLSPVPFKSFAVTSGNVYVADQFGIINNVVSTQDQADLTSAGCATLNPNPIDLLGKLVGANFNSTADQAIPLNNNVRFRIDHIEVLNTSVNGMSTAAGGFYTGAGKTGSIIVTAGQAYTGLTNPTTVLDLTLNLPNLLLLPASLLFFSLTTAQGAPATADIYVFGKVFP